jgi:hypothetical protein
LKLEYYEDNSLIDQKSKTTTNIEWDEMNTDVLYTGSDVTKDKMLKAIIIGSVSANGWITFDTCWLQTKATEKYRLENPPSLPYSDRMMKLEKRERGITGKMFVQHRAAKKIWEMTLYACSKSEKDKLQEFFEKGYKFLLFFEPNDTWKERAEVVWDTDEFSFEVLPGNEYWSGTVRLAEV